MKKLLIAVAAFAWAGSSFAGDYHNSTTLRCSQCHTMHASRQHGLNDGAVDPTYPLAAQGFPNAKLLLEQSTNATCLACHDGLTTAPDVLGANASSGTFLTANARSAGALNGSAAGHTPGTASDAAGTTYADWMGHTLGATDGPPGYGTLWVASGEGLNCANCHAVHGSAGYRNLGLSIYMGIEGTVTDPLNPFGSAGPTYAHAANTGAQDVYIAGAARNYQTASVSFGVGSANTSAQNGMNAYCAVCHGNFHGAANTNDPNGVDFIRHPTSGIARSNTGLLLNYGTANDQTSLVRPAWVTGPAVGASFQVACLTCHKGHGNARGYGLIYPDQTGAPVDSEQGDAAADVDGVYPVRTLCITCHPMGR